jgi:hypothetical protein
MAVQWLTIGSISGPAAQHLWEAAGAARRFRDSCDDVPQKTWDQFLAPVLSAIDQHADEPPIWSYHRGIDPWLMGESFERPFSILPSRQRKWLGIQRGPDSLYLAYRANWTSWLTQLEQQRKKAPKDIGHRERAHIYHALLEGANWCQTLARRIPAAVFLRRTCLRSSSGDNELVPLANKRPTWLRDLPAC